MPTVIIFGLELTGSANLSVFGPRVYDRAANKVVPPVGVFMEVTKLGSGTTEKYDFDSENQRWSVKLDAGAYLVRMEEGERLEVVGAAVAQISGAAAGTKSTFISLTNKDAQGMQWPVAWTATAAGSDPKNPWPPPAVPADASEAASFEEALKSQPPVCARIREE